MKRIILGDTHFDDLSNLIENEKLYHNQIKFFKEQLFPFMKEKGINEIIQLGDFTSKRTNLNTWIQHRLKHDIFDYLEENSIMMKYIIGNHDIYYKNSLEVFTLEVFEKAYPNNLKVYKEPTLEEGFLFIPWMLEEDIPKIMEIIENNQISLGFAHAEYKDFYISKTYKSTHGIETNFFKDIKIVTGHYHLKQESENILYVGTPYEMNWSDFNTEKGFYVLDEDMKMEFIENEKSLKHIKIYLNSEDKTLSYTTIRGDIQVEINSKTDYSFTDSNKIKIFIDKDNAYNKKIIEKLVNGCISYRVEVQQKEEILETSKNEFKEYNVGESIQEMLETDYQKEIFTEIYNKSLNDLKEIE